MAIVLVVIGFGRAFADMGVSQAIIHRQDVTRNQLSSLYWLTILSGLIAFLLIWLSTPLIIAFYNEPRLDRLMFWAAVIFLITPLGQQFQILLEKELRFSVLAKVEGSASIFGTVVAIWTALLGQGVFSLLWGQLAETAMRALLSVWIAWREWQPGLHFSFQDLQGYLGFGLYQIGDRSIHYFISRLDQILVGALVGIEALGYYTLAFNLITVPVTKINPVIVRVAFPVFSRIQSDTEQLRRGYMTIMRVLSSVNFPLLLGLIAVAPAFVIQVFGEEWRDAVILVQLLAVAALIRTHINPITALLLAKGRADLGFKWNLMLLFTQAPGIYLGAQLGGASGVALALIILQSIYTILNYSLIIRTMLGPCLKDYIMSMLPALALSMAMAAVVAGADTLLNLPRTYALLVVEISLGAILYLSLANLFMKNDIKQLRALFGRRSSIKEPSHVKL
jgi:O-antigen/teichoic acid export membrane protein